MDSICCRRINFEGIDFSKEESDEEMSFVIIGSYNNKYFSVKIVL